MGFPRTRMTPGSVARARSGLLACAVAAHALAGCGGDSESEGTPALSGGLPPGEGGTLVWAVADRIATIDPLAADSRAEELLTRQIHEPLVETLTGPFGDTRRVPGLATARASGDDTIWTLKLRSDVRFQDGTPFNAAAVLANAERWQTTAAGQELLPDLVTVFAPQADLVRFILAAPDRRLPERLASPRLGIVSPRALRPGSGTAAVITRSLETGTGPFELREREATRLLLARNTSWWGTANEVDLGPALNQVEFRIEPTASVRLALLDAGDVQLADELDQEQARLARSDPLLSVLRDDRGTWLGIERSVRGVESASESPSLSGAWLTSVTVAD